MPAVHRIACPQRKPPFALKPLLVAIVAALPLVAGAQSKVTAVPKPPPSAVPVPSASWRVYGSGGTAPVNKPNGHGGVDQTIDQTSARAIYQWGSFDIGAASSVTFDMATQGGSALNRVIGSTDPSRIFGKLTATHGGEIYLVNANGILFGAGAKVNTGALIASTLNLSDSQFKSGLVQGITSDAAPAFAYDGAPENFVDEKNFVRVDPGAEILTTNGGRVFLFAKRVENAGSIETPGGQTVLAAGGKVYLGLPTGDGFEALYASESNPAVPALRGLVVEVGNGPNAAAGSVANEAGGHISAPRGNITIVGMAVNQSGRLSATTSVSENGSIILRAQGGVDPNTGGKQAQTAGEMVLGAGSVIEVLPDETKGEDGRPLTSNDSAGFVESRIDIAGRSVRLLDGARITAPGATVNIEAEAKPRYDPGALIDPYTEGPTVSRIAIGNDAVIDVSGTTGTVIDGARNFVTTELLTSNDLKDAPLQKDGPLYRSRVTLDVRGASPILGDLSSYRAAEQRTVDERLSAGGKVNLVAQGGVLMRESARIDVSGGDVRFTDALVTPTTLVASDGSVYDLTNAPADKVYDHATNIQNSGDATYDRWGVQVQYGSTLPGRIEPGYTEGRAAGRLTVIAPAVVLAGTLDGRTRAGQRQIEGRDAAAAPGAIQLGAVFNQKDFADASYAGAVLRDLHLGEAPVTDDEALWQNPLQAPLPDVSQLSLAQLREGGFGSIDVAATGDVQLDAAVPLELPPEGRLRLRSEGGDVAMQGRIAAPAANVELTSKLGDVSVAAGSRIDVSGRWINQQQDGPRDTRAVAGGDVTLSGQHLAVGAGSVIDVSGGAAIAGSGRLQGGDAGSITLAALVPERAPTAGEPAPPSMPPTPASDPTPAAAAAPTPDPTVFPTPLPPPAPAIVLDGVELRGYSLAEGGSLSITVPSVRIGALPPDAAPAASGTTSTQPAGTRSAAATTPAQPAALDLDPAFFERGGFSSYAVDGRGFAEVAAGTTIKPSRDTYLVPTGAALIPTGSDPDAVLAIGRDPLALPRPVDLRIASSGDASTGSLSGGSVTVGQDVRIETVPQSKVELVAGRTLRFDGEILDPGGDVTLSARAPSSLDYAAPTWLWLGETSRIEVAGRRVLDPADPSVLSGEVLAGGNVTLAADGERAGSLIWKAGGTIDVRGAEGMLDVSRLTPGGERTERQTVASEGGSLAVRANRDLELDGRLLAEGGSAAVAGGSLSVTLDVSPSGRPDRDDGLPELRVLRITEGHAPPIAGETPDTLAAPGALTGRATVSSELVRDSGAADFAAKAHDRIVFDNDVDLSVARQLRLDSRAIAAAPRAEGQPPASVRLAAATVVLADTIPVDTPIDGAPRALPNASSGGASLAVRAGDVLIDGRVATQGLGRVDIAATGDLQLAGTDAATQLPGGALLADADLRLSAARVYPATNTPFTISAPGHAVTIDGGDPSAETPLSGGGALVVEARTIAQNGVVRAPQGRIELRAEDDLTLGAGSVTSVSADGKTIPYGSFDSDSIWHAPGERTLVLQAPPSKNIVLDAPNGAVNTADGSVLDLSGGGELVAWQFVPGPGGSNDVFGGADGAYAIVPSVHGLAPRDPDLVASAPALGKEIVIGPGAPVPPGRYTLLPARYALLEGGYLVKPETAAGTPLALGTAVSSEDGSTLIGARLADAGTGFSDATSTTWRITPSSVAANSSEIRQASATNFFAALAAKNGEVAPRLSVDAGTLAIGASRASLDGTSRFEVPKTAEGEVAGRGGEAQIAAEHIRVVAGSADDAPPAEGVLTLETAQLNDLGAATLLLGARRGAVAGDAVALDVAAADVTIANAGETLVVDDLVIAATDRVRMAAGSAIRAAPIAGAGAAAPVEAYALDGDGAAIRIAAAPGAVLTRTGTERTAGTLEIASQARLLAAGGTLVLDATKRTAIAADSRLAAADATITAARMVVGPAVVPDPDALAIGPALTRQLGDADALTLRAYEAIDFDDGSRLDVAAGGRLTLDTPQLRAGRATGEGAEVEAGTIALANSTGAASGPLQAGDGRLSLHAASDGSAGSGRVEIGSGAVAAGGASISIDADRVVALTGAGALSTSGDLAIAAPRVIATDPLADVSIRAGGALTIAGSGRPTSTDMPAAGAALALAGRSVDISGAVVLPAGRVTIDATGSGAADGVRFSDGARIDVSGRTFSVGKATVDLNAGEIDVASAAGDISIAGGVSLAADAAGQAAAGTIELRAGAGTVQVDGRLHGASADGATGGRLVVDSAEAVDLGGLAAHFTDDGRSGFRDHIEVRNRHGDQTLAAGTVLTAREIAIEADDGGLTVLGRLDASGAASGAERAEGGSVRLSAGEDLRLAGGARIDASAQGVGETGGQVELASAGGTIHIDAGSSIDVHGTGASAEGRAGRVTLRAGRRGLDDSEAAGGDVKIAAIAGSITGAERIDVEAVKVFDAKTILDGNLLPGADASIQTSEIADDGSRFLGVDGARAGEIAARLANGDAALESQLRIHPAAEIRSDGDLAYAGNGDWLLPTERTTRSNPNVGDTTLTLRAAGTVTLPRGIASGYGDGPYTGAPVDRALPVSDGGAIRIVGGADLAAADAMRTVRGASGDVVIGVDAPRNASFTSIATTTGEIRIAAARDVDMTHGHVAVYSFGRGVADDGAEAVADAIYGRYLSLRPIGGGPQADTMPFRVDGGSIAVEAGRDVRSRLGSDGTSGTPLTLLDWRLMREGNLPAGDADGDAGEEYAAWWAIRSIAPQQLPWYTQPTAGLFEHGIATMAGGDVTVRAGRDVRELGASAASSGYWTKPAPAAGGAPAAAAETVLRRFGGGDVRVVAGRDVVEGQYLSGGDALRIAAGRDVRSRVSPVTGEAVQAAQIAYENTAVDVAARRNVALDDVHAAFAAGGQWLWGLDGGASLTAVGTAGSLSFSPHETIVGQTNGDIVPAHTTMAAPQGSLAISGEGLIQQPVDDGALRLLARDEVDLSGPVQVNATRGSDRGLGYVDATGDAMNLAIGRQQFADFGVRLDRSARSPVEIVSAEGDVSVAAAIATARPLEIEAGGDVELQTDARIAIQHQPRAYDAATGRWSPVAEPSFIEAGGDLRLVGGPNLTVAGRGDLVLLAGGGIDLGSGRGVAAIGNTENSTLLPEAGANLTLVAGLRADGADYARAVLKGYAAVGGLGLGDHAGDVYAQLEAPASTVALGSTTARRFDAQPTDARLASVQALVGKAAYDASIAAYVQGLPGKSGLSDAEALAAFPSLSPGQRDAAPGAVLADAFARQPASLRQPFVGELAAAPGNAGYGESLAVYLRRITGEAYAVPDAIAAFEALPLERQIPFLNRILVQDLRSNGRVAAAASGDAAALAYARGYRSIDALFPAAGGRPEADIGVASSQLRTLQRADVTTMAPGGSVNAGETTALAGKDQSETGIVTVAGGNISAVVRDDYLVNRSRVFTLADGNILLWASEGDIDAGRGAKTVVGAPAPVLRLNADGRLELDTSGSFTGSGIAVLGSESTLDLYAPQGAIDAGEAGIRAAGNAFLGAQVVRGADDIQVGGKAVGTPPAPPSVVAAPAIANTLQEAANQLAQSTGDDEDERRWRRLRRTLLLEFLGFGTHS